MGEPYVVDGHASMVEAITNFSLLKKLVDHDSKGSLFARKVCVECSLIDQPYDEVMAVIAKINMSQIDYNFTKATTVTVKTSEDWNKVKAMINGAQVGESYIFNETKIENGEFDEMKSILKDAGCLLIDLNRLPDACTPTNLRGQPSLH